MGKLSDNYVAVCRGLPPSDHCLLDFGAAQVKKISENIPSVQWVISKWSDCSVSCGGGGFRARSVLCVDSAGLNTTGCPLDEKPPEHETCGCGACPLCEFKVEAGMKYLDEGGGKVQEQGGKLEVAKKQCVEALQNCAAG